MTALVTSIAPVTIVVPYVDEHADLLPRILASVAAQTVAVAAVEVIHDRDRHGAAWARNRGLAKVTTELVAFADADDELAPTYVEKLTAAQRETAADLVYPCTEVVDGRDPLAVSQVKNGQMVWDDPCGVPFGDIQERHLRYAGNFIPLGWLARTDIIRKVGGFPPSGGPHREEDYQLLVNLLNASPKARFHHVGERLYRYFFHDRNTGGGWEGTGASNRAAFQ